MRPHFIVLGAGAIGSYFGSQLSRKYVVSLVGRNDKLTAIKPLTIILLCTKSQDGISAIEKIKDRLKADTTIVIIQNGLDQEKEIAKIAPCRVVRAVTQQGAIFVKKRVVKFTVRFPTYLQKGAEDIVTLFQSVGIPTEMVDNIRQKEWEKLVFNCVINGLGTILNVGNDRLNNPQLLPLKKMIATECIVVAEADGISLDPNIDESIDTLISKSKNVNSTLQDLRKGKKTEIDYLNGAVVQLGKKYGIKTPVNEIIWRLIKTIELNFITKMLVLSSHLGPLEGEVREKRSIESNT